MGLIEVLLERVSVLSTSTALLVAVAGYILYKIYVSLDKHYRLKRLGSRAPRIRHKLPYGFDFVRRAVNSTMEHKNLEFWRENFTKFGGWTGETNIIGRRIIFTADPENIKAILATQFGDYGKGQPFHEEWKDFLGDSIFTTDGDLWHNSRHLIRPQFIKDRVSDLHCFESHIETLFRAIANGGALNGEDQPVDMKAGNGRVIDISELFFRYTLDVATDFLLGKDVKSLSTPREPFAEAFGEVQRVQNIISRAGPLNRFVPRRTFWAGIKTINEFVNVYIERTLRLSPAELESKSKGDAGYTFLHALAGFTHDRKVLRDQLVAVLLAGRDTTASTLSWTIYELSKQPACVARLRQEILSVVGPDRTPTYADLKGMKYLQNVMNETLRLYPSVPFNVRLALKDTTLPFGGGPDGSQPVAILKDTPIGYSPLVMQRRADLYPPPSENFAHPDIFSPERWYVWQPKPWQYIPFNGGPRICIGQQFALTEMAYVLVRLFQRFERVESYMDEVDGGSPTLKAEIVLQPGDGVRVAFWEPRKEV
ncbi:cytochrome P450 [Coniochaeta sp. PMI_546]|nr:cytochrome P450 [Coniochaeta sp. PMI_546]